MKQFNLEEYLKNPSKKVVTRDRKAVKIHCTNYDSRQPIIAEIEGHNYSQSFTKDGRYYIDDRNSPYDLFFDTQKYEGWLNVYRHTDTGEVTFGAILHTSRKEAEKIGRADGYYAATAKVEWEE